MKNRHPLPLFEPSSDADTLKPAEHRAHMAERRAEEGTRTTHGYVLEPPGLRRGPVVDRYVANVRARRAERAAAETAAPTVVLVPDLPADPRNLSDIPSDGWTYWGTVRPESRP